jgi:predicted dehydrogenase
MKSKQLRVAMIGHKFMGKAHTHAWRNAARFFDLPAEPVLKVVVGRDKPALAEFADHWGWESHETDWRKAIERDDVDVVDISTPTALHAPIAIAAAKAGKHIFCEKPLALNVSEARKMLSAAKKAGVVHYLNHNYRRCPAVMLARQLIDAGRIGRIFHWRGAYLQSWIVDPNFPLTWHLQKEHAGAGPHWDLGSHSVDLARFLVGEVRSVQALTASFVAERPLPGGEAGTFKAGSGRSGKKGKVTVEDASLAIVEFDSGAIGSFEVSRFATGRKNYNHFEIYGERGALAFNLERMNELELFDNALPGGEQGFRTILVTEAEHPYLGAWWPPGHIIGYEHEFVHAVADFVRSVCAGRPIHPNFHDGLRSLQVLEAGLKSAATGRRIAVPKG